jgi:hypothetical protein
MWLMSFCNVMTLLMVVVVIVIIAQINVYWYDAPVLLCGTLFVTY